MANQTIFKLHTVMPRSFDFDTISHIYLEKGSLFVLPVRRIHRPSTPPHRSHMPHQRSRVPIQPHLPHLRSIHLLPSPFSTTGSYDRRPKPSTPPRPGS